MDDVRAVMAAAGLDRAVVLATFEAAPMAALFAASYPERVGALVLFNPYAKGVRSPDYPWGRSAEEWRRELAELERGWGTTEYFDRVLERSYGSAAGDESFRRWFINMMRYGASPGAALNVHRMAMDVDIREVLPAVRVPSFIIHGPRNAGHAPALWRWTAGDGFLRPELLDCPASDRAGRAFCPSLERRGWAHQQLG